MKNKNLEKEMNKTKVLQKSQNDVDIARDYVKASLEEEDSKKHSIVEQVIGLLAANDIAAYLYTDLPHPNSKKGVPTIYQFNTFPGLMKFDEKGEPTDETADRVKNFNVCMWRSLFETIVTHGSTARYYGIDKVDASTEEGFRKKLNFFLDFLLKSLSDATKLDMGEFNIDDKTR